MKTVPMIFTVAAILAMSSCGSAGNDSTAAADSANEAMADTAASTGMGTAVAEEDAAFAVEAANGGMTEVQLGQLAQEKGTDPKVKEFGAMMVRDHSKANDELKALAASKNITLPAAPGEEKQKVINELSEKTGKDFDKAYIAEMVKDHEKDVRLFEEAQSNVQDPDIRNFIVKTLPVLKMHLEHVKGIERSK